MMLGLSLPAFTMLHVAISVAAIVFGLIFFIALMSGRWLSLVNGLFLDATLLTSATGFLFPPKPIGPPFIFGVVSIALLVVAFFALYVKRIKGPWSAVYLVVTLIAQWLNMVVLVVQSFQKIPVLHALAPAGNEPPFLACQALVLGFIVFAGWRTLRDPKRLAAD